MITLSDSVCSTIPAIVGDSERYGVSLADNYMLDTGG